MPPFLPRDISRLQVPPLKCQGIKTKLVRAIASSLDWPGAGRWIEPFLGSGVVLFNIQPEHALAADTNCHLIRFYQDVQSGALHEDAVREYLTTTGQRLADEGESFFYQMREEFNREGGSLRLLFLNRACFNGLMRFNGHGGYNVPFCRKPTRFRPAYITKIVNQVKAIREILAGRDWEFRCADWRDTLAAAVPDDFVYLDPPYTGRHTDYFNRWSERDAIQLAVTARALPCPFALSMWHDNAYRSNDHLEEHWAGLPKKILPHFYHVGASENLRNPMREALVYSE